MDGEWIKIYAGIERPGLSEYVGWIRHVIRKSNPSSTELEKFQCCEFVIKKDSDQLVKNRAGSMQQIIDDHLTIQSLRNHRNPHVVELLDQAIMLAALTESTEQ